MDNEERTDIAYYVESLQSSNRRIYMENMNIERAKRCIRSARARLDRATRSARIVAVERYAWPGGYAMFGVTDDGSILCPNCIRAEWPSVCHATRTEQNDGWRVIGITHTSEMDIDHDDPTSCTDSCAHCGRRVTSY